MNSKASMIVGVDFGTTFTGLSYVQAFDKSEITPKNAQVKIYEGWSYGNGDLKVPSKICYDEGAVLFGFDAQRMPNCISLIKLSSLDEQDVPEYMRQHEEYKYSKAKAAELNKTGVEMVSDYLRAAWAKFLENLCASSGGQPLDDFPLELIFTVPAIWPAYYRQRLNQAIQQAGMLELRQNLPPPSLRFITEPEAAAYMAIQDESLFRQLTVNDVFMIVDCGGATIDVISYQVLGLHPLRIKEFVPGDGGLHGACVVDGVFKYALKAKYRGEFDWNIIDNNHKYRYHAFDIEWEKHLKCPFNGEGEYRFVPLWPFCETAKKFTANELQAIFEPAKTGIIAVVDRQIQAIMDEAMAKQLSFLGPRLIRIAGGFGRNPYIQKVLKEKYETQKRIKVIYEQGSDSWTLILRGASISALMGSNLVISRILRESLAVDLNTPYIKAEHRGQKAVFDRIQKKWMVPGQFRWLFKRGDEVKARGRITELELPFPVGAKGSKTLEYSIWSSTSRTPPASILASKSDDNLRRLGSICYKTPLMCKLPIFCNEDKEDNPLKFRLLQYHLEAKGVSGREVGLTAFWVEDGSIIGKMVLYVNSE